jgi:hypothetical protein
MSTRRLAGTLVLLLLTFPAAGSVQLTRWKIHVWQRLRSADKESPQASFDRYLRRVAAYVPAHGKVGLVLSGSPSGEGAVRSLYLFQYALAPRQIVLSSDCEFVIVYGPATAGTAGLAAWTKNEGLLFLVVCVAVVAIRSIGAGGRAALKCAGRLLLGALPMVVALKALASANDLLQAQSAQSLVTAFGSVDRMATVAAGIGQALWFGGAGAVGVLPIVAAFLFVLERLVIPRKG